MKCIAALLLLAGLSLTVAERDQTSALVQLLKASAEKQELAQAQKPPLLPILGGFLGGQLLGGFGNQQAASQSGHSTDNEELAQAQKPPLLPILGGFLGGQLLGGFGNQQAASQSGHSTDNEELAQAQKPPLLPILGGFLAGSIFGNQQAASQSGKENEELAQAQLPKFVAPALAGFLTSQIIGNEQAVSQQTLLSLTGPILACVGAGDFDAIVQCVVDRTSGITVGEIVSAVCSLTGLCREEEAEEQELAQAQIPPFVAPALAGFLAGQFFGNQQAASQSGKENEELAQAQKPPLLPILGGLIASQIFENQQATSQDEVLKDTAQAQDLGGLLDSITVGDVVSLVGSFFQEQKAEKQEAQDQNVLSLTGPILACVGAGDFDAIVQCVVDRTSGITVGEIVSAVCSLTGLCREEEAEKAGVSNLDEALDELSKLLNTDQQSAKVQGKLRFN